MLRFWLLGGARPTLPWEFFVTIGGALLAAAGLFAFLYPLWATLAVVGVLESLVFVIAGSLLLVTGLRRRKLDARRAPGSLTR